MSFERTEWGGRFTERPYYPMVLANGVDAVSINIMGSGDTATEIWDQEKGACYSFLRSVGWFKSDRRVRVGEDIVYGNVFPLLEFSSAPILNGDTIVPRTCRQFFDPLTATLHTFIEQLDNRTLERLRVKVTTFMTREHLLVEHYEVLAAPSSGAAFAFFLGAPSVPYLALHRPIVTMDRVSLDLDEGASCMAYEYAVDSWSGRARSWFTAAAAGSSVMRNESRGWVLGRMSTVPLQAGDCVTRYLAVVDNEDAADPAARLESIWGRCHELSYDELRAGHVSEWGDYFATSRVTLPDPAVQYVYEVSRYLLRANHHPESGFQPVGIFPHLWQGVMFWDSAFCREAFLTCGNLAEAERILDHLARFREPARELAASLGAAGERLEWTVTSRDMTPYTPPSNQYHNNAVWAHQIFLSYPYTGDLALLAKRVDMVEALLLFVTDHCLQDCGDHLVVAKCAGLDESYDNEKVNDTWTNAITLKALIEYREALRLLSRPAAIDGLDRIIEGLSAGLQRNVDEHGVLQSFHTGALPHWGSLIFDLFPEHPALLPTLARMMENYDPEMDLYNFHGVTRYGEKAFPWATLWAARCFAGIGDARAGALLRNALASVNYFGGIPERVFYHGELYNHWFGTGHAAMVWSVNGMLASATPTTLRLLSGADPEWGEVAFENLHAGHGLVVSARISGGKLISVEVKNLLPGEREIELIHGNERRRLTLPARGKADG